MITHLFFFLPANSLLYYLSFLIMQQNPGRCVMYIKRWVKCRLSIQLLAKGMYWLYWSAVLHRDSAECLTVNPYTSIPKLHSTPACPPPPPTSPSPSPASLPHSLWTCWEQRRARWERDDRTVFFFFLFLKIANIYADTSTTLMENNPIITFKH